MGLAERIDDHAGELATEAMEQMYTNPFWDDRFGDRGRQFALQDGERHVSYLVESLRAQDAQLLATYARWLQGVLTTRGMCSLHLDENFARLSLLIGKQIDDSLPAILHLQAGRDALRYPESPARRVQDRATQLASETLRLCGSRPSVNGELAVQVRRADDMSYLISYLADALALGRADSLMDYLRWWASFLARHGQDVGQLGTVCTALSHALGMLDPETVPIARAILQDGSGAILSVPS